VRLWEAVPVVSGHDVGTEMHAVEHKTGVTGGAREAAVQASPTKPQGERRMDRSATAFGARTLPGGGAATSTDHVAHLRRHERLEHVHAGDDLQDDVERSHRLLLHSVA